MTLKCNRNYDVIPEPLYSTMIQKINISADLNRETINELGRVGPYYKYVKFPTGESMTPENFCYWLHGFFEVGRPESLTKEQIEEIKNHLALVFKKETPQINITPSWVNPDNPPFTTISKKYCG